ncbi:MAG: hypothetical protein JWN95_105 [Frankiales bacterium]|nr:hypothetical protein [Frankiales bacterium]
MTDDNSTKGSTGKVKTETDVDTDEQVATSRDIGGVENPDAPDQASTTGTTPTPEYVGRIAGDDVGYAEETGAERRAQAAAESETESGTERK